MASAGASKPKSGSKADFTPCGAFAEKMEEKLESLRIHVFDEHSKRGSKGHHGVKYRIYKSIDNTYIKLVVYDLSEKLSASYDIYCKLHLFKREGSDFPAITSFLKDTNYLKDQSHLVRGGRRRSTKHRSAKRRSAKRRRSTRKN